MLSKPKMIAMGVTGGGGVVTYSISGTVYDADGSTPVSGATVALGAYSALSDVDGTYTITSIPPGTSGSMTCAKTGYSWTAKTIAAMSGNLTAQNYTCLWWAGGGSLSLLIGAWQPAGAASLDASYLRLAGSGGNADLDPTVVGGTAPTWNATNGWIFNGAFTQYLKTGIVLTAGASSVIIKFSGAISSDLASIVGTTASGKAFIIRPNRPTDNSAGFALVATTVNFTNEGIAAGILTTSAKDAYKNGALLGAVTAGAPILCAGEAYIGAIENSGSPATVWTGNIQAIAFYSGSIASYIAQINAGIGAVP